jgi:galactose-1-phosphate uridylyltransferase
MARTTGSKCKTGAWTEAEKRAVWNKAREVPGQDKAKKRKDACGAVIEWDQHGVTNKEGTGWEVDHIVACANDGTDDLSNLQPLQWENNRSKADGTSNKYCVRT